MKKNRMRAGEYTFWAVFGLAALTYGYRNWYMISDPLGFWGVLFQLLVAAVLWRFLGTASRNVTSLILIALYPQVLNEIIASWEYIDPVRIMTVGTVLLTAILSTVIGRRILRKLSSGDGGSYRYWRQRVWKYFVGISCSLLIVVAVYGRAARINNWSVMMREVMSIYQDIGIDQESDVNTLSNNIETVSRLDPRGGWKTLGLEEKTDVLETIVRIECRYLGMEDTYPTLNIAYTDRDDLLGYYNREKDMVTLSYMYLCDMNVSGYAVCQVLCHELYHRVQFYQVKMLEALESSEETRKYANLLILHDASVYRDEADHYHDGTDNYYLYASQQLERDADHYGDASVAEYYQAIQEYFSEQEEAA